MCCICQSACWRHCSPIRITADPVVKRQMQALRQGGALILRRWTVPEFRRGGSALFDFPESYLKIIPTSMHHLFQRKPVVLAVSVLP